jgi:3-oxoacyl-[acyl-carrier protein] reductase
MNFTDQVVVVTGAGRGIGKEITLQFAKHGAKVACIATKKENAEKVVEEIKLQSGVAMPYGCDVSQKDQVEVVFQSILEDLGTPTVLVNNAGVTRDTLLLRMKEEDWDQVLDVNLKGTFHCIKAVTRPMMKAHYGRIINISSIIGVSGAAGQVNYAASKAGLIGLTKSVAKELGSRGITCNVVAPGYIQTDMTEHLPEEMRQKVVEMAPLGRLGCPGDVAPAVLFLASEAAGYITGQTLIVDGGLTL